MTPDWSPLAERILLSRDSIPYDGRTMEQQNPIEEIQEWTATLTESVGRVAIQILEFLPALIGALVLLLVGWVVARLFRYATIHITERTVARLAHSRPMDTRVAQPRSYNAAPDVAGRIVFWVVLLFFVLAASEVLELKVIAGLLGGITAYLPRLFAGLLILFIGLWLAEATRAVIKRTTSSQGIEHGDILAGLAQILVLLVVFSIAAGQIGIDNTLLVALVAILFGVMFGAIALAFSLGARITVANLLAAQSIMQVYSPGDTIRINEIEGKILRITRTSVILETLDGQTLVPAKRFSELESVQLSRTGRT